MKRVLLIGLACASWAVSGTTRAMSVEDEAKVFDSFALEKQGDLTQAIKKMTSVLEHEPDSYVVNLRLGWLCSEAKKYKNAIDHYEKAAAASAGSVEPLLALSLLHTTLGNFADAAKASQQLLDRDPKNYLGLVRLIGAEIQTKDFGAALTAVQAATKLYPADPVFLEQLGFVQMQTGNVADAKKSLGKLLLVSPGNVYARTTLSEALAH